MDINKKNLRTIILSVFGCIFFYWLLHETDRLAAVLRVIITMLSPFIIGAIMAFILNVPMRGFEQMLRGVKNQSTRRALAILLTLIAVFIVLGIVMLLIVPQLIATVESLGPAIVSFFNKSKGFVLDFLNKNPEIMEWLQEYTNFENINWSSMLQRALGIVGDSLTSVFNSLLSAIGSLSNGIFNAILSFVFAIYCLSRKEVLASQGSRILYSVLSEHVCDEIVRILRLSNETFSNFISGQCLEALILGCMFAVAMPIFGFPYVPLISVIIAVTALVPIVGAFAGCVLGGFFILVVNPVQAFWFVIMFLVIQQIEGNLIYPRVVGTSIGLPGMWVLVAVAVGGDLFGVLGMLLMIPLTSVLYALLREFTQYRLAARGIDPNKLVAHPQEIQSKHKAFFKNLFKKKSKEQKSASDKENINEES